MITSNIEGLSPLIYLILRGGFVGMGLFKRKFKVGDQVEIINTEIFGASVNLGDEATVEIVYDKDDFLIKFKDGRTQCIFVDPHHYVKLVDTPFKCFLNLFRKGEK